MKKTTSLILFIFLFSCASKPVLYPNKKYKKVGEASATKDVEKCMDDADKFVKSSKGKKILKSAGKGSVVGAAMGAVSGLIFGDLKKAAISGAAIGGVGGGVGQAISPDRLKQSYTNRCLSKKGYEVIGWD